MNTEVLQFLKEMGWDCPLENINEKAIKDTYTYQFWQLRKAYIEFATEMGKTRLGSFVIKTAEYLDRLFDKIF